MGTSSTIQSKPLQRTGTPLQEALTRKLKLRAHLDRLPFKEKYNMVVAMQRRRAAILGQNKKTAVIWPAWED